MSKSFQKFDFFIKKVKKNLLARLARIFLELLFHAPYLAPSKYLAHYATALAWIIGDKYGR